MDSSVFSRALAQSIAKLQKEIQTHHDACLEAEVEGRIKYKHQISHHHLSQRVCFSANDTGAISNLDEPKVAGAGSETLRGANGYHPCQLVAPPVAPPPARPPIPPIGTLDLDDDGNRHSSWRESNRYSTTSEPLALQFMPAPSTPTTLRSCRPQLLSGSTTPTTLQSKSILPPAVQRWEHFVFAYALADRTSLNMQGSRGFWEWKWQMQPTWVRKRASERSRRCSTSFHYMESVRSNGDKDRTTRTGDRILSEGRLQVLVMEPNSDRRMTWAILGALFILYDLITIPLGSFVVSESPTMTTIGLVTTFYWILDLPLNFFIGFVDNDIVEMRPYKIAQRYATSWFGLDLALVCGDVCIFVLERNTSSPTGAARSAKTARVSRMFRFARGFRLLRLFKLSKLWSRVVDNIESEYKVLTMKLCIHVSLILFINHYVACGWFALGDFQFGSFAQDSQSWILVTGIDDAEPYYQYLMSLHWSMTQFTPSTNNINPTCAIERAYAIFVVLFALVTFSSFVSSVTNTVNEMRRINMEKTNEEHKIREFISERTISQDLAMRIWHSFRQNYMRRKRAVMEHDIRFFLGMPQSLIAKMREEMYMPVLGAHGSLGTLKTYDKVTTKRICNTCFYEVYVLPNQDVFLHNAECHRLLFIRGGSLHYRLGLSRMRQSISHTRTDMCHETSQEVHLIEVVRKLSKTSWSLNRPKRTTTRDWAGMCDVGRWVSEAALWVVWRHCGQLSAETSVDIIALDCKKFHGIIAEIDGPLFHALKGVAIFFIEYAEEEMQSGKAVTDISVEQELMDTLTQRSVKLQMQRLSGSQIFQSFLE